MLVRLSLWGLGISLAAAGCAPSEGVPSVDEARAFYEEKNAKDLQSGQITIVDFRKVDGVASEMNGVPRYRLDYEVTREWPNAKTCSLIESSLGCAERRAGERSTDAGRVFFEKTENGWRVQKGLGLR